MSQYPPPPEPSWESELQQNPQGGGGLAIASMVLGIVGLTVFICCAPIGIPVALVGLVLGFVARNGPNRGMAIAGIIMCSVVLVLSLVLLVLGIMDVLNSPQSPLFNPHGNP